MIVAANGPYASKWQPDRNQVTETAWLKEGTEHSLSSAWMWAG